MPRPASRKQRKTRMRIEIKHLELARGHDGFLRGAPEPVLIVGAYLVEEDQVRVLARSVCRVPTPGRIPSTVVPTEPEIVARWVHYQPPARVALLVLAIEEDGGDDVQSLYAALERHGELSVWPQSDTVPSPQALHELALGQARVNVLIDDSDMSQSCASDEWVDAATLVVPAQSPQVLSRRLHLISADGRNDWTAELGLYV